MRHFALCFLALLATGALSAKAQCPANAKPIPFHNINQHQMVVGVSINHSGPYDFLLDTGTQMTVVDQSLAADLHVSTTGKANVAGVSLQGNGKFGVLGSLEVGGHASTNFGVLIYDMKSVQNAGFAIRGLLGEDFLSRFNVLIDNSHSVLCLDETGIMSGDLAASR